MGAAPLPNTGAADALPYSPTTHTPSTNLHRRRSVPTRRPAHSPAPPPGPAREGGTPEVRRRRRSSFASRTNCLSRSQWTGVIATARHPKEEEELRGAPLSGTVTTTLAYKWPSLALLNTLHNGTAAHSFAPPLPPPPSGARAICEEQPTFLRPLLVLTARPHLIRGKQWGIRPLSTDSSLPSSSLFPPWHPPSSHSLVPLIALAALSLSLCLFYHCMAPCANPIPPPNPPSTSLFATLPASSFDVLFVKEHLLHLPAVLISSLLSRFFFHKS